MTPPRPRLALLLSESVAPGYSSSEQERDGRHWAHSHGFSVVRTVKEAADQEPWREAMQLVKTGAVDALLTATIAHLSPNLVRQETLLQFAWAFGAKVFTMSDGEVLEDDPDDPMRTAMRQMRGVMEQLVRSLDAQRGHGEPCLLCGRPKES
ncbi:DNA invertase Pin-like site-specific DNA recombinase [Streptomyces sp. B4I13]|uniref:recombinase family protein n=1 Tax=Streptomyces sp. B4I13 TaxID=3042271 RepID=UPI0027861725|nr:recombinase family protein [Streptomyces sp. B4I13]MDQ0964563.1 DNA invertase Pin-like site-specific DNA recombinase [Streptomyces sp. B4I13]